MALTLADLPLHSFTFKGFPPNKEGPRKRFIAMEAESPHTLVFFMKVRIGFWLFSKTALRYWGGIAAQWLLMT